MTWTSKVAWRTWNKQEHKTRGCKKQSTKERNNISQGKLKQRRNTKQTKISE